MLGSGKPSPLVRRSPSKSRIGARSGSGPASPHCVLLAAAALAALLVSTSYTFVPFLRGGRHAPSELTHSPSTHRTPWCYLPHGELPG